MVLVTDLLEMYIHNKSASTFENLATHLRDQTGQSYSEPSVSEHAPRNQTATEGRRAVDQHNHHVAITHGKKVAKEPRGGFRRR